MSFYSDASVVMIPSGYKTSKVYCAVPTDGAADLSFSRSNDTATRVGPDGLIEKVRTNVMLQSNTFNTTWAPTRLSVTSGQSDPNGGTTAWKISNNTTTNSFSFITQTVTGRTFSIYAKAGELTQMLMYVGGNRGVYFDLTNGSFVGWYSVSTGINYSSTSVGGGWYRYVVTLTTTDIVVAEIYTAAAGSIVYNLVSGEGLYLWRSQMELGDIATDYIATTSAAVSVGPVANVPRLDYLNSSCPRLLLEPQRTNLRTSSEQFSSLSPSNVTVTSNDTTSPDGYANADKLTPSGSGFHTIGNTISVTAGQKYTISIFYKYGTHKNIGFYDNNTAGSEITINMETNAFTLAANVEAGGVVPYGNGWYRAYATFTAGNANMVNYIIFRDNTNNGNYTGDGSYSWFYGWQIEAGAYATSYIPTLGSASTRGSDAASKTGISSLIGQTAGTIFVDFVWNGLQSPAAVDAAIFSIGAQEYGTSSIAISNYNGTMYARVTNGVTAEATINFGSLVAGTRYKAALAYANNDVVFYVNGVSYGSDTSASIPAISDVNFQNPYPNAKGVNQAILFKTRLSNADLAALTA